MLTRRPGVGDGGRGYFYDVTPDRRAARGRSGWTDNVLCVLHPVGSLPPRVYWIRRALVVVALIVAVILVRALFGGGGPHRSGNLRQVSLDALASAGASPSSGITSEPGSSGGPTDQGGQSDGDGDAGGDGGGDGGDSGTGDPGDAGDAEPIDADSSGDDNSHTSPPGDVPGCSDDDLTLTPHSERDDYPVDGSPAPDLRFTVTNTSDRACSRDVGAARQEIIVSSSQGKVWSTDDCAPGGRPNVRVFGPGDEMEFYVHWPRTGSRPGCDGPKGTVSVGRYEFVARFDDMRSEPVRFELT